MMGNVFEIPILSPGDKIEEIFNLPYLVFVALYK